MDIAARALPRPAEELEQESQREKLQAARLIANEKALAAAQDSGDEKRREQLLAQIESQRRADALAKSKDMRPPLTDALVERSIKTLGVHEFSARLPFFLLALLVAMATYFLGVRLRGPRVGLLGVVILVACPLFVFQARQLTSELGTMAGATLMIFGALGFCSPSKLPRAAWLYAVDAVMLLCGAGLAYYDSGFLVGLLAPIGAVAFAGAATCLNKAASHDDNNRLQKTIQIGSTVSVVIAIAVLCYFVFGVFDLVKAEGDVFSIAGYTLRADEGYQPLLAGVWRTQGDLKVDFDSAFKQIAFGLFPWICLAPIAIARIGMGGQRGTNTLGARTLFAWAALAWVVSSVVLRKVGPTQFAAVPALALGIGIWLDELLTARAEEADPSSSAKLAPPLVAIFVLFAGVVIAKDLKGFPLELLNVHLDSGVATFPKQVSLHKPLVGLGLLFTLSLFSGLYFWRQRGDCQSDSNEGGRRFVSYLRRKARAMSLAMGRYGIAGALGLSLVIGFYLAQVWTPKLSTKLSSKATFSVYHALREPGNALGIVGKATAGTRFYADGPYEELSGRPALTTFLARPERVFALVHATELCAIHTDSGKLGFNYYVVDDSNADKVMLSNRMWNAATPPPSKLHALMRDFLDRNPLSRAIVRSRPEDIKHKLSANFDDQIELIGIDLPESVGRGDSFEVTMYYKVLKPLTRNWQVFVHFDGGGVRFQGDHYPVNNRCGTNHWQPGDYIVDQFSVDAGGVTNPRTKYTIWTGFFVGSGGNWENMKALTGEPDDNNRVRAGSIQVK